MESAVFVLAFIWAMVGAAGAFMSGKGYLWRIGIFLGPLMFVLFPGDKN